MASILKVDAMQGVTAAGDITITSEGGAATQSLQQGLAKAWANIDGTGTIALRDSLNVSSLTDDGTGAYDTSFSNSFNNTNYCAIGNGKENSSGARNSDIDRLFHPARTAFTTSVCEWLGQNLAGGDADLDEAFPMVMGDLA